MYYVVYYFELFLLNVYKRAILPNLGVDDIVFSTIRPKRPSQDEENHPLHEENQVLLTT